MPPSLTIDIHLESPLWKTQTCYKKPFIKKILLKTLKILNKYPTTPLEVSFLLTDNASIQYLNTSYRKKDKPTNVLAFPLHSPQELAASRLAAGRLAAGRLAAGTADAPCVALGDIVLAYETIAQEAHHQHKTFSDHFTHLIVHGWLHLWGYDHQNDQEAHEMEQLEITILAEFAIPNPYKNMI